jgi:Tripartite tricarboxylate transporter family receptor
LIDWGEDVSGPGRLITRQIRQHLRARCSGHRQRPQPARPDVLDRGGTPTEIIEKLNSEFDTALSDSKMKARLADLGSTVLPGSPADFGKLIAEDTEKGAKVVKFAGIKAD